MTPPMRSAAAMCAVMCALLPAALSHTVETEFVTIPKGGWHVFEVPRDASHTLLHDIKFTNRASILFCRLRYSYAQLDVALEGATVPVGSASSFIGGLNHTSTVFFGRNTTGDTVSANVTAEDCGVELQAAFNFYELLDTAVVVQKVGGFELSGISTFFTVSLLPTALYVESVTLTMVSPCPGAEDSFLLAMSRPSSSGSQLMNLTEVGEELTRPVEGMLRGLFATDATGWVGFLTSGNCTPAVEVNVRSRQLVVPGTPVPPTYTPTTPYPVTPFTPVPIFTTSTTNVVMWVMVSYGIAAVAGGIGLLIYFKLRRQRQANANGLAPHGVVVELVAAEPVHSFDERQHL
eukprot:TRINITY_DN2215_c0_g1_i6.p1 TRINITY_DN2215_c0_g1~~TRINITY_DN2215_c0_g1_i6.p1  ORF type:complete len:348 (+),score=110.01 TRINITY_DN2215_c0_g1_i6:99-1142(+)